MALMFFVLLSVLQAAPVDQPKEGQLTRDEISAALLKSGGYAGDDAIQLIQLAEKMGRLARFGKSKPEQLAAGIAALVDAKKPKGIVLHGVVGTSGKDYSAVVYLDSLESLGRLAITSLPTGASVTVDGYRWETLTDADGFAAAGRRNISVSDGKRTVRVQCEVAKETITTLKVDLDGNTGVCSAR